MTLLIFALVSLAVLWLGNREPAIFLVTILSSFFIYYASLALAGIDLQPGDSLYAYCLFYTTCAIFLLMRAPRLLTVNRMDRLYLVFCIAWLALYLVHFDHSLFAENKVYRQAPVFVCFTFLVPILLKPVYSEASFERLLRYTENVGFGACIVIFFLLLAGFGSREVWTATEESSWEVLRYAPIRGFFSNRQATLLAMSIVIFASRAIYGSVSRRELFWKFPLTVLSFGGIVISGSRGIFFICLIFCIVLAIRNLNLKKKLVVLGTVSVLFVVLLGILDRQPHQNLTARVLTPEGSQFYESGFEIRFSRYSTGLSNFAQSPLLGNGMSKMSADYDYSHNLIISVLEDMGLIGAFWLLVLGICVFFTIDWRAADSTNRLVVRNLIFLLFVFANVYGTIISHAALFLLISLYYFHFRTRSQMMFLSRI